ncbi:leukotriene A4 hydrolase [Mycena rosella]|uniref:Leukotriene A4 hydrolase n=1 Tax=Mycena rosella TaxID=1033263 RepID=A0AAD7F7D4_MYCRO|nr:leukotriene A4 hydrolase [Mycena rosella]
MSVLHDSPAARGFSFIIGAKALVDDLARYTDTPRYQQLVIDFASGEDPDDAYSRVPYEKGANLILHLERVGGGLEVFLPYVKDYVSTFLRTSIATQQWKAHLYEYYAKNGRPDKVALLDSVDWQAWLYGDGLKLPVEMTYDATLAQAAYALADHWDAARASADTAEFTKADLDGFNANQIIVFLERLQALPALPLAHITHLGTLYALSSSPNAEIRLRFYALAFAPLTSDAAVHFAAEAAKSIRRWRWRLWAMHKAGFHPIAKQLIDKIWDCTNNCECKVYYAVLSIRLRAFELRLSWAVQPNLAHSAYPYRLVSTSYRN